MKKEIIVPVLIIFMGGIFVFVNILVYFTKGNHRFIKMKLKVGAIILTLTSIVACHSVPKTTCYEATIVVTQEEIDSIANAKKQDSIKMAENQKHIDDSIAFVNEQRKKDSVAKRNKINRDSLEPSCYKMPYQKPSNDSIKKL